MIFSKKRGKDDRECTHKKIEKLILSIQIIRKLGIYICIAATADTFTCNGEKKIVNDSSYH
jgi:hypothetical protein